MARARDYKAEYRRRQQRARARGFTGYAQQRRFSPKLRRPSDFARLPQSARAARTDALRVLELAREQGITIEEAAHRDGTPAQVVRWWLPDALQPTRRDRTVPRRGDRELRLRAIVFQGDDRVEFAPVRGSRAAQRASRIFDVQWRYAHGQATEDELAMIRGQRVAGRTVESDPARLVAIAEAGSFDVEEAYRAVLA
jgi:hypothetical protein